MFNWLHNRTTHQAKIELLLQQAHQRLERGAPSAAIAPLTEALNLCEQHLDEAHPLVSTCLHNLASAYRQCGQLLQAESLQMRAIRASEKAHGASHPETAVCLVGLAAIYADMERLEEATQLLEQVVRIYRITPPDPLRFAETLNNLAELYRRMGRYAEAEPLARQAYELLETTRGEDDEYTILALNNLGMIYYEMGRYDRACETLEIAYDRAREFQSVSDEVAFGIALNYAVALHYAGDTDTLLELLQRYPHALLVWKRRDPQMEDSTLAYYTEQVVRHILSICATMHMVGAGPMALFGVVHAKRLAETLLGDDHELYWTVQNNLAETLASMGRFEEAIQTHFEILEWRIEHLGMEHPETALTMHNLASVYYQCDAFEEAEEWQKRALAVRVQVLGELHPDTAYSLANLGALYLAQERYEEAEECLQLALAIRKQLWQEQPNDPMARYGLANSLANLAGVYTQQDRHAEAIPLLQGAEEHLRELPFAILPRVSNLLALAESLQAVGADPDALAVARQCYEYAEQNLGSQHPITRQAAELLEQLQE